MPLVGVRSLIETGTPWSGPRTAPRLPTAAVARRAAASACSAATVQYAFRDGFTFSMRASTAFVTSSGETLRRRIRGMRDAAGVKHSSSEVT
jgi:hypothetical protein